MFVDMHNHLKDWSPDGGQTIEELIISAKSRGIEAVGISDHYDINSFTPEGRQWIFDADRYWEENSPYRAEADALGDALIGVEISFLPDRIKENAELIKKHRFDFVIISLHEYEGIDPILKPEGIYNKPRREVYNKIVRALAQTAASHPDADIIGHYDFFSRYAPFDRPKIVYDDAPCEFDLLFKEMAFNNQALEINTGTIEVLIQSRGCALEAAMPDERLLKRFFELGGKYLTIGSDSHFSANTGRLFYETGRWLKKRGICELTYIKNKQRYMYTI